jgi:hypothetical protein
LQETIKAEYTQGELAEISDGFNFEWVWTESHGHSGGTLVGVRTDEITVLNKDKGDFFSSMLISSNLDKFKWGVVNVYGPVQLERKTDFLNELTQKVSTCVSRSSWEVTSV